MPSRVLLQRAGATAVIADGSPPFRSGKHVDAVGRNRSTRLVVITPPSPCKRGGGDGDEHGGRCLVYLVGYGVMTIGR